MLSSQLRSSYLASIKENSGKLLVWGIILVILGIVAIGAATATTLLSVMFLGCILMLGGAVMIIDAFSFWWKMWGGFFLLLILGVLYVLVGMTLINNPVLASQSLTLLVGVFYLIIGVFRSIYSLSLRVPGWGYGLLSGILCVVLGFLILENWPASGLFIIGLFIGIDLLVTGWTYIMASLLAKKSA